MSDSFYYDDKRKDLPVDELFMLFYKAGWTSGDETPHMLKNFNVPFINSTFVISAWDNGKLIGAVRVLSDLIVRSTIYDLVVDPDYQNKGIGTCLLKMCIDKYPDSAWLVETTEEKKGFYEKAGFLEYNIVVLQKPSKWF